MYGNITKIWGKYYDVTNEYVAENLKSIKFEDFDKKFKPNKNKEMFNKIIKEQKKYVKNKSK